MKPTDVWKATLVRRWHHNPALAHLCDQVGAHQGRCAVLVMTLFPGHSLDLLRAAVTHDMGEVVVGDLGAEFKRANPEFAAQHRAIEGEVLERMGFAFNLSAEDKRRLNFVDRLDAALFVRHYAPSELRHNGWPEAIEWLLKEAIGLGLYEALHDAFDGAI